MKEVMVGYTIKATIGKVEKTYEIEETSEMRAMAIASNMIYADASEDGQVVDEYTEKTFTIAKSLSYTGKEHSWTQFEGENKEYAKKAEGYYGPICDKCGFSFNLKERYAKWDEKSCTK